MTDDVIAGMSVLGVLGWIEEYRRAHGYAPSRREIAKQYDVSPSSAQLVLKRLIEEGLLEVTPGVSRGVNITGAGMKIVTRSM